MPRVAVNGWFLSAPYTGSGVYVRELVSALSSVAPDIDTVVIAPDGRGIGCHDSDYDWGSYTPIRPGFGKLGFEQFVFPRKARELKADLLHVPYWGACYRFGQSVVVSVLDVISLALPEYRGGLRTRLYGYLLAASAQQASAVISISDAAAQDISRYLHIDATRIHTTYLAARKYGAEVDTTPATVDDVRRRHNLPERYVLYFGGFDARKNVESLVRAYALQRNDAVAETPLVIAGRVAEDHLPRMAQTLGVADRIRFVGEFEESGKPVLLSGASAFVYPSYYEGFGLPVVEAMACGVPVIASDIPVMREIAGQAAILCNGSDPADLRRAIASVLGDSDLSGRLRVLAAEREKRFTWQDCATRTAQVYRKTLQCTL